jgi:hypothetical protein
MQNRGCICTKELPNHRLPMHWGTEQETRCPRRQVHKLAQTTAVQFTNLWQILIWSKRFLGTTPVNKCSLMAYNMTKLYSIHGHSQKGNWFPTEDIPSSLLNKPPTSSKMMQMQVLLAFICGSSAGHNIVHTKTHMTVMLATTNYNA